MIPLIEEIKSLLSSNSSTSSISSTSPVTVFNSPEIFQEIENAPDVFIMIEEVEISENNNVENNNNQINIDLDKPLETKELLDKVKKDLYNAICFYWKVLPEDYLLLTILDPRIKSMGNKIEEKEILCKNYEEFKENYLPTPLNLVLHHQLHLKHQ